jgi:hypothetical protein
VALLSAEIRRCVSVVDELRFSHETPFASALRMYTLYEGMQRVKWLISANVTV